MGSEVIYTVTMFNNGNIPAQDVVVIDPLPAFLEVLRVESSAGNTSVNGSTVTFTLASLAPGEIVTARIITRVRFAVRAENSMNTVTLSTTSASNVISNDVALAQLQILEPEPTAPPTPKPTVKPAPQKLPVTARGERFTLNGLGVVSVLGGLVVVFGCVVLWARTCLSRVPNED